MLDWKSYWDGWIIAEWKRSPISNYTYCKSALDRTIEDVGICDQQGLKVWNKTSTQEPCQLTWMRKASSMTSLLRYPTTRFTTPLATEDDPMSTSSCIINISIWLYDHCKLQAASWLPFANIFQFSFCLLHQMAKRIVHNISITTQFKPWLPLLLAKTH